MAEVDDIDAVLDALRDSLAEACPTRIVTREFLPYAGRVFEELEQGILTVTFRGEENWKTYRGRSAQLGVLSASLIGQLAVNESDAAVSRLTLEKAELAMAREVKQWLANEAWPGAVRDCVAQGYAQSGQMDYPYGWVVFNLEVRA